MQRDSSLMGLLPGVATQSIFGADLAADLGAVFGAAFAVVAAGAVCAEFAAPTTPVAVRNSNDANAIARKGVPFIAVSPVT
jgi:hypothetical protein